MSEVEPLTEEEVKYVEENQKSLQIAIDNCYILFDPKKTQTPEDMLKFINSEIGDRLYIYLFITNTCEIVESLTPQHIISICDFYKSMSDQYIQYFSKLIQDAFFAPIEIETSGMLQFIWTQLMDSCMTKTASKIEMPLPSQDLEQVTADQGVTEQPETEIIEL